MDATSLSENTPSPSAGTMSEEDMRRRKEANAHELHRRLMIINAKEQRKKHGQSSVRLPTNASDQSEDNVLARDEVSRTTGHLADPEKPGTSGMSGSLAEHGSRQARGTTPWTVRQPSKDMARVHSLAMERYRTAFFLGGSQVRRLAMHARK